MSAQRTGRRVAFAVLALLAGVALVALEWPRAGGGSIFWWVVGVLLVAVALIDLSSNGRG